MHSLKELFDNIEEDARELNISMREISEYSEELWVDLCGLGDAGDRVLEPIGINRTPRLFRQSMRSEGQACISRKRGGYYTKKPGNIFLNWKALLANVPENALIVASAASASWLMIFAALALTKRILDLQEISLTKQQVSIMLVLSAVFGAGRAVSERDLFLEVNKYLKNHGERPLNSVDFHNNIDELVKLQSITIMSGNIRATEKVSANILQEVWVEGSDISDARDKLDVLENQNC